MLQVVTDSFTHTVSDRKGGADTFIFSIVIQAVFDTVDDSYTTEKNVNLLHIQVQVIW